MKKTILRSLLLTGVLSLGLIITGLTATPALANHYPETDPNWNVTFTADNKMQSNFSKDAIDQTVKALQPGDDASFKVTIKNANASSTNWYMENKVLKSLEDRSALAATRGGGYSYELVYVNSKGEREELFNSNKVGGEQGYVDRQKKLREGLNEATENLEGWFFLEELATGKSGHVELNILLDGETQGNDYQDTLADVQMEFAVELTSGPNTPGGPSSSNKVNNIVKTGDSSRNTLYMILAGAAGAVLLILAIAGTNLRRKEAAENAKRQNRKGARK